jgi:3-methyl-2-oxobutanoate hydroxymethyltransferase
VFHDLVGYADGYLPKFVKRYTEVHDILYGAVKEYVEDVRGGKFPDDNHSYHIKKKQIMERILKENKE